MKAPLRVRFALLAAALVLVMTFLVGTVGYLALRHSLLSRASATARNEAARLVGLIGSSSDAQGESLDVTDTSLTRQLSSPGLRVEIDRPGGQLIQATRVEGTPGRISISPGLRRRCLSTGSALARVSIPPAEIACRRVGSAHAPRATIAVAAPLDGALASVDTLRRSLLISVLVGGLVAAVLSLMLARRALRPIKRMATTAETIRSGDLTRRVDYRGADELGELARVLDACFDELQEAIERQRRFSADASHELKTPLAAIRANVDLLSSWGALDPAARASALASLDQSSRRASRLVADLLHLVKVDRQPARPRTQVALDDVVLRTIREAEPLRIDVSIRVERLDEAVIEGDPTGLEQLLLNLLDNALAASPPATQVRIALRVEHDHATITVTDAGPGIPPSELPRIFDRFYSKKLGVEHRTSSGLGLTIAREIATAHGGTLSARNNDGGGATFTLTLPVAVPNGARARLQPGSVESTGDARGQTPAPSPR